MKRKTLHWHGQYIELGTGVYGLGLACDPSHLVNEACDHHAWFLSWKAYIGPFLFHGLVQLSPFKPITQTLMEKHNL